MRNKKQAGFTLIELILTISIAAILAAIAIPNYLTYREKTAVAALSQAHAPVVTAMSMSLQMGSASALTDLNNGAAGIGVPTEYATGPTVGVLVESGSILVVGSNGEAIHHISPSIVGNGSNVEFGGMNCYTDGAVIGSDINTSLSAASIKNSVCP
jgi:prepilin-type N-terminal cleavage/methylation domain-containing protein